MTALHSLNLFTNPLVVKCARERLRMKNTLSWGLVVIVLAAFIYAISWKSAERYLGDYRADMDHATLAAKFALAALVLMQGVILLLIGTGSVASGVAQERMGRVLDYQRMTPMSPMSKIVGYLFGLPIREYFMVGLTMPIVVYAAVQAQVKLSNLLQLYLVGFVSVWLYHMTGMVAGMVSAKPWRASMITQGMVVLMYFIMPQLASVGFTFFLYLTPRPVFARLASDELGLNWGGIVNREDWQESVYFFDAAIHPTLFTLLVQGFLLIAMFVIVYRKWREDSQHAFTKAFAVIFFAGAQTLLVGSLWPWLTKTALLRSRNMRNLFDDFGAGRDGAGVLIVLLYIFFFVSLSVILLLVNMITPSRYTYAKGIRRSKKKSLSRVPWLSDAASAMPYSIIFIILTCISYFVLLRLAEKGGTFHLMVPSTGSMVLLSVWFAALVIYVQAVRQLWGMRGLFMALFLLWIVPFLTYVLMHAAKSPPLSAAYVSTPVPLMALGFAVGNLYEPLMHNIDPSGVAASVSNLTLVAAAINVVLAVVSLALLWRRQTMTKITELARFLPPPVPEPELERVPEPVEVRV
ncbi:MAG: hypothetical protein WD768_10635 [Phycisphaeraceae bacterium]